MILVVDELNFEVGYWPFAGIQRKTLEVSYESLPVLCDAAFRKTLADRGQEAESGVLETPNDSLQTS